MLEVTGVHVRYGRLEVLHGVTLRIRDGELVALIGANGAGKTTLLRTISGVLPVEEGDVRLDGQSLVGLRPDQIVGIGVAHVAQGRELFPDMTVWENLELGAMGRPGRNGFGDRLDRVCSFFPILEGRRKQRAGTLSGGEQQMLAIARALMSNPRVVLLDEPSAGLAPIVVDQLAEIIQTLRRDGLTILLVEQNAYLALELAERAYILETGAIVDDGTVGELKQTDRVRRAYLGG